MDITFTLQSTTDGSLMTGQASNVTVYLSIDGAAFSASTNAAQEIGRGLYKVTLTSAESEFTTMYYQPVCSGAQTNLWSYDAPVTMPTVPTASDNAAAVWGAQEKIVNIDSTQIATLATADALATVGNNVSAVKDKTDNLPSSPAAVGSEMTLTSATITAIQNGLATNEGLSSLASHGDTYWVTANVSGLATGGGLEALANYGDSHWSTANVSALATADALSSVATNVSAVKAKTDLLPAEPAAKSDVSAAQTAIINRGNEAWLTATGFATPTNITDAVTTLEEYGDQNWQGSGGGTPGGSRPLYCNTAMLYAHWTQEKIDAWANDSQTAIDNAIEWACNKIDDDLDAAASVPFQPVPADIRDLAILAAGARLAELAGVTGDASVTAALAYYVTFVEDYNYRANA